MVLFDSPLRGFIHKFISVMSGIITGDRFIDYFGDPDAVSIGTMVAVLEIGALSTYLDIFLQSVFI